MSKRVCNVEDAAKELGIGRSLGYQLARTGELPGVRRLGNRYLVSRVELDAYLGEKTEERAETRTTA